MPQITVYSPITGEKIKTYEQAGKAEAVTVMSQARLAAQSWAALTVRERCKYLARLREVIVDRTEEIVSSISLVTGKVPVEALASDVLVALNIIKYYERESEKILKRRKVRTPLLYYPASSYIEYKPMGVALVIAPWNYPLQLALVPTITAVAAGNAVILKPSEITLTIGELISDMCRQAGWPEHLVQVVYGDGETGRALIEAKPDTIFFTGSSAAGQKVMESAAKNLIPVTLELGSKDPMIVLADANLERAVNGALYGAFSNSGQICVSVKRIYVQEPLYERFAQQLAQQADQLRIGADYESDLGPLTLKKELTTIDTCIQEAVKQGAVVLTSKKAGAYAGQPVVLKDTNHGMRLMTEEIFGPVVGIMPFQTTAEAVRLANDSVYGLCASIWTADLKQGALIASQLQTGNCVINDVVKNIGNPRLPFGGVKKSGMGRYHGPEGLLAFSTPTAVMINPGRKNREINWFPYSRAMYDKLNSLLRIIFRRRFKA